MEGVYYRVERRVIDEREQNVIVGVNPRYFEGYLLSHNMSAPPIPDGVHKIADGAFGSYKFDHISIPESVNKLSSQMFADAEVKHITYAQFYDLNLDTVTPEFTPGASLRLNKIVDGELDNFKTFLRENDGIAPTVPEGVRYLGQYSLRNIPELKEIYLPLSCTRIGEMAFQNCTGLELVKTSEKLFYLSKHAFEGCTSLKEIDLPTTLHCVRTDPFRGCSDNLKINLFNGYKTLSKKEFYDESVLGPDKTLMYTPADRNKKQSSANTIEAVPDNKLNPLYTCLETTDEFIIVNPETGTILGSVSKEEIRAQVPGDADKIIGTSLGYGDKYFFMKQKCEELGLSNKMPRHAYIILNTPVDYIKNYIDNQGQWKAVLGQIKKWKVYESLQEGKLSTNPTHDDCSTLYKLAVISGLFEEDPKTRDAARMFLTTKLLGEPGKKNKGLNLDIKAVNEVFGNITNNPEYNKEFATYFLLNNNNFLKLYNKLTDPENKDRSFLHKLYKTCGYSNIKYEHDGNWEDSLGKLHDAWEKYKINNAVKTRNNNDGTTKEVKTLSFVDYALQFGVGGANFGHYSEELAPYVKMFGEYYTTLPPIKAIKEMYDASIGIIPYVILPNDCPWTTEKEITIDVNQIGVNNECIKTYKLHYPNAVPNEHSENVNIVMKELEDYIAINSQTEHFRGRLIIKGTQDFLEYMKANCEMGNCSNITGTGSEGLKDVLFSNNAQPAVIEDKASQRIIAQVRLMFNKACGYVYGGSLETQSEVRDTFSPERQEEVVKCFLKTIASYMVYYNDFNQDNPINLVVMGNTAHCTITPAVERFVPELKTSLPQPIKQSGDSAIGIQYLLWERDEQSQITPTYNQKNLVDLPMTYYKDQYNTDSQSTSTQGFYIN